MSFRRWVAHLLLCPHTYPRRSLGWYLGERPPCRHRPIEDVCWHPRVAWSPGGGSTCADCGAAVPEHRPSRELVEQLIARGDLHPADDPWRT